MSIYSDCVDQHLVPEIDPDRSSLDHDDSPLDREPLRPQSATQAVAMCDGVIDLMAVLFGVCGRQLREPGRSARSVSRVRQIGMYVCRVTLCLRLADIAAGFGRDKSTVLHACHQIEDMRDDDDFERIVAKAERITRIAFSMSLASGGDHDR